MTTAYIMSPGQLVTGADGAAGCVVADDGGATVTVRWRDGTLTAPGRDTLTRTGRRPHPADYCGTCGAPWFEPHAPECTDTEG